MTSALCGVSGLELGKCHQRNDGFLIFSHITAVGSILVVVDG